MLVSVLIIHYVPSVMLDNQRRNREERRRLNQREGHR